MLSQSPQTFKGSHEAFFLMGCIFTLFIFHFQLHGLDSMSERLGRIISNAFTVSVARSIEVEMIVYECVTSRKQENSFGSRWEG